MFKSTRRKLTAWYLAIIMAITLSFSAFVYMNVSRNTHRALEGQRLRMVKHFVNFNGPAGLPRGIAVFDAQTLVEIRNKTLLNLLGINLGVFVFAGALGYFLAGRTLKPIEIMIAKQKRFISDAAHEIKTPLTAMKANLEVTLRDKNLTLEESKDTLKSVIEDVDKLNRFTNRLLKQSKYQNGINHEKAVIELDKLLQKAVGKLTPLAKEKNETINISSQQIKVLGNKDALEELFINIIENSIKYNQVGKPINIVVAKEGNFAIVSVEDFGKGISQSDLPYIFEPFYRADKSRSHLEDDGFGLGLAIAKEIAERHEGKILVESKVDQGTKFIVKLPLSRCPRHGGGTLAAPALGGIGASPPPVNSQINLLV